MLLAGDQEKLHISSLNVSDKRLKINLGYQHIMFVFQIKFSTANPSQGSDDKRLSEGLKLIFCITLFTSSPI